jgi:hypothetical protein
VLPTKNGPKVARCKSGRVVVSETPSLAKIVGRRRHFQRFFTGSKIKSTLRSSIC